MVVLRAGFLFDSPDEFGKKELDLRVLSQIFELSECENLRVIAVRESVELLDILFLDLDIVLLEHLFHFVYVDGIRLIDIYYFENVFQPSLFLQFTWSIEIGLFDFLFHVYPFSHPIQKFFALEF